MRLLMHDIDNDDVFTRVEDVEAWVSLGVAGQTPKQSKFGQTCHRKRRIAEVC